MASTAVPFDPNYRVVMAAKVQGTTSDVAPLLVDSVTGRLLVDVSISGAALQDGVDTTIKATIFDYTNSNPLAVVLRDTNGDYVSVGGGTQYDEDTVSTAADKITMAGVVRRDTASTLAGTDGDRTQLIVDANGLLHINVGVSVLPTGASTAAHQVTQNGYLDGIEGLLSTGNTNSTAIAASASVLDDWDNIASDGASVSGDVESDAADAGEPVKIGGIAKTANITAVANNDRVNATFDKLGKQVTVGSLRDLKANQVTTITSSTTETTIVASVSSVFVDLYGIIITNTSATAVNVAIKDATAGTTRFNIAVPAGDTRGFMLPEGGAVKQTAVTSNWTATCSASVASVIITALTVQNL